MIQLPVIVLSYNDFVESKKLFSFERNGEYLLPIFTDVESAVIFQKGMHELMEKLGDNRRLMPQVCQEKKYAIDMFYTIGTVNKHIAVVINPESPTESNDLPKVETKEKMTTIPDLLESLHDLPVE
jgi:hypothetical protein